jgi:hypothetical protein
MGKITPNGKKGMQFYFLEKHKKWAQVIYEHSV